jgi:hypothetical protein
MKKVSLSGGSLQEWQLEDGSKHSAIQERTGLLFLIHDLLPWQDEAEGLTATQIRQQLCNLDIECGIRTLERHLATLLRMAHVDYEGEKPRRYRRLYSHRLTDSFPGGVPLPGGCILRIPDWPSEIYFEPDR